MSGTVKKLSEAEQRFVMDAFHHAVMECRESGIPLDWGVIALQLEGGHSFAGSFSTPGKGKKETALAAEKAVASLIFRGRGHYCRSANERN